MLNALQKADCSEGARQPEQQRLALVVILEHLGGRHALVAGIAVQLQRLVPRLQVEEALVGQMEQVLAHQTQRTPQHLAATVTMGLVALVAPGKPAAEQLPMAEMELSSTPRMVLAAVVVEQRRPRIPPQPQATEAIMVVVEEGPASL